MAAITPGTEGTLASTTLEGIFHEALNTAILYELDTAKNPQTIRNITLSIDLANNRATGTFSFAATKAIGATGGTTFTPNEHLTSTGFTPGTGGTIKSAGINSAIVEIAELIQAKEADSLKNPTATQNITGLTYDSEANNIAGTFSYAITQAIDTAGKTVLTGKPYLLD